MSKLAFAGHMHIPLRMDLALGGAETEFFALNFIGRGESIAVLDTALMEIVAVA